MILEYLSLLWVEERLWERLVDVYGARMSWTLRLSEERLDSETVQKGGHPPLLLGLGHCGGGREEGERR